MSRSSEPEKKPIDQYDHKSKERCNSPPVGLITPETDCDSDKKTFSCDPHFDPALEWAGKSRAQNPPLHEAIEFYKHRHNWSNRMNAGVLQMIFLSGMNYE